MSPLETTRQLLALIESLTARELQTACFDALRRLGIQEDNPKIHPRDLGPPLIASVTALKDAAADVRAMEAIWPHALSQLSPQLRRVSDFLWRVVRAGLAIPLPSPDGYELPIIILTPHGWQVIRGSDPHPLLPGAVDRVVQHCPQLDQQVVELLSDARECLSHGLNRPAVALLGVAYEAVVEAVLDALIAKGIHSGPMPAKAWQRVTAVRDSIAAVFPGGGIAIVEKRGAAKLACDLADFIRDRRNQASHTKPRHPFQDHDEFEELLVSGFRRLPALWAMKI